MSSTKSNNLKHAVRLKISKQKQEISKYHSHSYSFKIQPQLRPTAETLPIAEQFFEEIILPAYIQVKGIPDAKKQKDKLRQFLCLICSLWLSSSFRPLRVSLNKSYYSSADCKHLSDFSRIMILGLNDAGYLLFDKGYFFIGKDGKRWTRIAPNKKLKKELLSLLYVWSDPFAILGKPLFKWTERIKLKKKWKQVPVIPQPCNRDTRKVSAEVLKINKSNSQHMVILPDRKRDQLIITDLHRVFNNKSFADNGRFYTGLFGYQHLSKRDRARLLIDNHQTIELDFKALHPTLLYAMKGLQYDDDPYTIVSKSKNLRDVLKLLLLALFNTENAVDAVRAGNYQLFFKKISKPQKGDKFVNSYLTRGKKVELRKALFESGHTVKELIELFKINHEPIAEFFCTGQGYNLMNIDSRIAVNVLNYFTGIGEACLCVHDSFIVKAKLEQELRNIMELSYKKITRKISPDHGNYSCKITKN